MHSCGAAENEFAAVMRDRLEVYALLARLFGKEVDEELLSVLRTSPVFEGDDDGWYGALGLMQGYLAKPEASVLELARDYAKAFCGAGSTKRNSAYPFESVYTSENGMLMQEARDEAMAWYRRFGLGKSEAWHDCEDHVALEFEFMGYLIARTLEADERGDERAVEELLEAQRDFSVEHLANWVPHFAWDVDHKASTDFYRGLARFASQYVKRDAAALADTLAA